MKNMNLTHHGLSIDDKIKAAKKLMEESNNA